MVKSITCDPNPLSTILVLPSTDKDDHGNTHIIQKQRVNAFEKMQNKFLTNNMSLLPAELECRNLQNHMSMFSADMEKRNSEKQVIKISPMHTNIFLNR